MSLLLLTPGFISLFAAWLHACCAVTAVAQPSGRVFLSSDISVNFIIYYQTRPKQI